MGQARNGTVGHEMGRARNGTGTKWPGTKWPARNGPARNGRARNGIQPSFLCVITHKAFTNSSDLAPCRGMVCFTTRASFTTTRLLIKMRASPAFQKQCQQSRKHRTIFQALISPSDTVGKIMQSSYNFFQMFGHFGKV